MRLDGIEYTSAEYGPEEQLLADISVALYRWQLDQIRYSNWMPHREGHDLLDGQWLCFPRDDEWHLVLGELTPRRISVDLSKVVALPAFGVLDIRAHMTAEETIRLEKIVSNANARGESYKARYHAAELLAAAVNSARGRLQDAMRGHDRADAELNHGHLSDEESLDSDAFHLRAYYIELQPFFRLRIFFFEAWQSLHSKKLAAIKAERRERVKRSNFTALVPIQTLIDLGNLFAAVLDRLDGEGHNFGSIWPEHLVGEMYLRLLIECGAPYAWATIYQRTEGYPDDAHPLHFWTQLARRKVRDYCRENIDLPDWSV